MRMMASTIGVFTLMFMYIALLGLPFELSVSFIGFALLPLLFYLCCVLRTDKYRLLFPKGAGGVGKCGDCLRLVLSMLMVAMVVYVTGGAHSSYKLLFYRLPYCIASIWPALGSDSLQHRSSSTFILPGGPTQARQLGISFGS